MKKNSLLWGIVDIALLIILLAMLGGCVETMQMTMPRPEPAPKKADPNVVLTAHVQNHLDFLYFAVAEKANLEAWFCMSGFVDKKTNSILLHSISPVFVDSADGSNIVGRPADCPKTSIGTIHFHPGVGYCDFSNVDINTAHYLPFEVEAIVCRPAADSAPKVVMIMREEIDARWNALPHSPSGVTRQFTAVYRFVRKPP